jgi:hypothetical protein
MRFPPQPNDSIGVPVPWDWPNPEKALGVDEIKAVQERLRTESPHRESDQSSDWVGHVIGEVLGIDSRAKAGKAQIKTLIGRWRRDGFLKPEIVEDQHRKKRPCIVVGRPVEALIQIREALDVQARPLVPMGLSGRADDIEMMATKPGGYPDDN